MQLPSLQARSDHRRRHQQHSICSLREIGAMLGFTEACLEL